jgi:hypothetical protein
MTAAAAAAVAAVVAGAAAAAAGYYQIQMSLWYLHHILECSADPLISHKMPT